MVIDELIALFIEALQDDLQIGEILKSNETDGQFSFTKKGVEYVCTIARFKN